jgi:hypothetical protein
MIDPLTGLTFGQYELQDRLGRGGMASVYRALQPGLGRSVAVKVLSLTGLHDPTLTERFRREARLAANLMHPNIVPVYDFGEWQGYMFIVMALVSGGTLKERLHGPLPVEIAVRLVGQVADALGYAHGQGVFHRDVKPTNVLLAAGDWAMLSDFGIARALGETTRLTSPSGTIGTPAYMAPEQWLGGEIDGRADLYSLGIVLYELLAGTPPFTATTSQGLMRQHLEVPVPSLATRRADLPGGFDDVLRIALAKEPDHRYRHAGELKAALETVMRGPVAVGYASQTALAAAPGTTTTSPDLGQTFRVPMIAAPAGSQPPTEQRRGGSVPPILLGLVLVLAVLLAGSIGYIVASSRGPAGNATAPAATTAAFAAAPLGTAPPPLVAPTQGAVPTPAPAGTAPGSVPAPPPPTVTVASPPTATAPPRPEPTSPPPPTPAPPTQVPPTQPPTQAAPTAPPNVTAAAAPTTDQRFGLIERHVGDYFAALNAGDYARAQAACCTQAWRARYPLDDWRKNFTGVTDLRFARPFRYPVVEAGRIIAEIDYSFTNGGSSDRRFFTLRWTFVPVGSDWLADEATASPQR